MLKVAYTLVMSGPHKKISESTLSKLPWLLVATGVIGFAFLVWSTSGKDVLVLSIANAVLFCIALSSLYIIVELLRSMAIREEEMGDMRSDFVAVASHELRSPLSAVRWYLAELRGDASLSQDARKIVNDLYDRICSLIDLTTTFFMMTTADKAPLQSTNVQTVNIAPTVGAAATAAIATGRARNIKIDVQVPLDTQIVVKADPQRLRIVFDNLLSNAIKYSREGTVVTLSYRDEGSTKCFSVHDTGIGVPKEEIEKIFSGYHRAANAKRSGKLGSGFGLYMVKKIVDMHQGTVTCDSSPENGTTFTVALPAAS